MEVDGEEYGEIDKVLNQGIDRIEELRDQKESLLDANKKLVKLVKKLEAQIEKSEGGDIRFGDSEYSFDDGWEPTKIIHDQNLDLSGKVDLKDIDRQIGEIIKSMKSVQDLNEEK